MALLEVKNLSVDFHSAQKNFQAVDSISFELQAGEILGIVGESGSGKSVTALAIMGLLDTNSEIKAEKLKFNGMDLLNMDAKKRRKITGADIAMIFQEPISSLDPCFTIGYQIIETLKVHQIQEKKKERALELLQQVGIADPAACFKAFPHQLSGGMNQRVMIAIAIACSPKLLIADEPTTALDVTIQAQIMDLLLELQKKSSLGVIFISHDLALISESAHRIAVMYAGQLVEIRKTAALFRHPLHPYSEALISSLPENSKGENRLKVLSGSVPSAADSITGCMFHPRCPYAVEKCRQQQPELMGKNTEKVRCYFPLTNKQSSLKNNSNIDLTKVK